MNSQISDVNTRKSDGSLKRCKRRLHMFLATSRPGRIALHVLVALEGGQLLWHWQGILRELARS
jgi:hypothetical protein